jgi:serine protease Do
MVAAAIGPQAARAGGFDRALAAAMPRIVKLYGLGAGLQAGYGTGVIVSEDGLVLTVYSLLIDARQIKAVTADGTLYGADVVRRDRSRQLALLRLKSHDRDENRSGSPESAPFPHFDLTRETTLAPGDWVLAAGNPFKVADGAEPASVAHGVFSARTRLDARRRLKDFPYRGDVLVIDAITSNPGAPGSALVNLDGEFLGMIGRQVISNLTHTHFNYAVPRDVLFEYVVEVTAVSAADKSLEDTEQAPVRANVLAARDPGFRLSQFGYQRVLPFVDRVRPGSPADRAGLRKDDLILSVNGKTVPDADTCKARLERLEQGEPIDLVIRRGRAILTVRIEISQTPYDQTPGHNEANQP